MKSISGLLNTNKGKKKKNTFVVGRMTIHVHKSLYLHCGPSTKVPSKLKSTGENEVS